MADEIDFTYRLNSSETREAAIAQVRLEVGDNDIERGIRPNGKNYTDDELWYIYELEDSIVGRAAARICEQMATAWSSVPRTMFGSLVDPRHVGRNYMRQAETLRAEYGYTDTQSSSFSIPMKRTGT
jgi:hypothetical protein